jgi:large subunit ribosomal protein L25
VSSAPTVLNATSRTEIGKAAAHLRRTGKVPAVVFGHGLESIAISLDAHEFDHLRRTSRSNAIISLTIDGQGKRNVMLRGFQIDPRTRHLLHVDLFALKSGEEVTVDVPLRTIGESYAVDRLGGTLLHTVSHIRVRALPEKLPELLEISIESLVDFEIAIHVRDLALPEGVTLMSEPDDVVAKVAPPKAAEETVVGAAEAAATAAAAAAAAEAAVPAGAEKSES